MAQNPTENNSPNLVQPQKPLKPPQAPQAQTANQTPPPAHQPPTSPTSTAAQFRPAEQTSPGANPPTPPPPTQQPPPEIPHHIPTALKILLPILTILVITLFGGALTLAYTNYSIISPPKPVKDAIDGFLIATPLPKNPRMIIQKSLIEMAGIKTATQDNTILVSIEGEFPVHSLKLNSKGPINFKNFGSSKLESDVSAEIAMEGLTVSMAGSIKQIDKIFYFKLTQIPTGSFYPIDGLKNQWFFFDISKYQNELSPIDQGKYDKALAEIFEIFKDFIGKSHEWTVQEDSNKNTFKLILTPPKEEITSLFYDIVGAIDPVSQSTIEDEIQKEQLHKFLSYLDDVKFDIQINKNTYLIEEFHTSLSMNIDSIQDLYETGDIGFPIADSITLNMDFTSKFSNYNIPIIIDIPKNAKDIETFYEDLLGDYPVAPQATPEATPEDVESEQSEEETTGIRELIDSQSEVLGEKSFWDINLLEAFKRLVF